MYLNSYGNFSEGLYFASPHKHHKNSLSWLVSAGSKFDSAVYAVVASTPQEAAKKGIAAFLKDEEARILEENQNEQHPVGL